MHQRILFIRQRILLIMLLFFGMVITAVAQKIAVTGVVVDYDSGKPVEFATIVMSDNNRWAMTDQKGRFSFKDVPTGKTTLIIQCLGYATRQMIVNITQDIPRMNIRLKQDNLKLEEVTVTAKRKTDVAATSYTIDRTALDNQQIINLTDVATLLPGGKSVNPTLMDDSRIALRSGSQEKGNASFGTAIEVDGMRLGNNAEVGETAGASTRTISTSNIESVEVLTGIPSVEYGDLSNGVVKVHTRRGKSPFIVEGKMNQHTRQIAVNKGFDLGNNRGVLNASLEHARSFTDAASPHTAYQRNILSLHYMNTFLRETTPLTLNVGLAGNVGGYNSDKDPDMDLDTYTKKRDNTLRANMELNWLLNKSWLTNLSLRASYAISDHRTEDYQSASSATTLAYNHSQQEGYFLATPYDVNPQAPIVLGPTGYWHVRSYNDSRPENWAVRLKGDWTRRFGQVLNRLMAGVEYTGSRNNGRGIYYEDMRYAADGWREYRYDALPSLNNIALYAEEKVSIPTTKQSTLELTAGLRDDITHISRSAYGTISSLSPRFNGRYIFWQNKRKRWVSDLVIHAGWGKSVKLPSFQILYPDPRYYDVEVFKTPSTTDNTTISGYYTRPLETLYNPNLKWQYTNQTDIGIELNIKGTRVSLSAFHHRTHNPYIGMQHYNPISYQYTTVDDLNAAMTTTPVASADRIYTINQQTGQVIVGSKADGSVAVPVANHQRKTYYPSAQYVNGSPIDRYGLEWIVDFRQIKALSTSFRLDGNYYYYKGLDDLFFTHIPNSNTKMSGTNEPYQYVGWYRGTNATSGTATASVSNGTVSKQLNLNATVTTHIPKIRLIVALRIETTLYNYRRTLSEYSDGGCRGIALADKGDYTGTPYQGEENRFVAIYPEYYSTWDKPEEKIPFAEKFLWAKDNDPTLYNDLSNLVVKTNYAYTMNPNRLSAYYSANLSVTKEIGDHVSVSFYANNFFNNMKMIHSSQTDTEMSLFGSGYIPSYYYGMSLRLKL